jgi:AcrR family transcriptional regulator
MLSTKDRILSAATDLLDAGGPSAVTLRAVGEAAGISQSAPYRHFADKRALLDAMVRQIIQQMRAAIETATSEAVSPSMALNLGVSQYFDFARRFPVRYRLLLEESRADTAVGKEAREAFAAVADLVHVAESRGELRGGDSTRVVALVLGAVHGIADLEQFGLVSADSDPEGIASLPGLLVALLSRDAAPAVP